MHSNRCNGIIGYGIVVCYRWINSATTVCKEAGDLAHKVVVVHIPDADLYGVEFVDLPFQIQNCERQGNIVGFDVRESLLIVGDGVVAGFHETDCLTLQGKTLANGKFRIEPQLVEKVYVAVGVALEF